MPRFVRLIALSLVVNFACDAAAGAPIKVVLRQRVPHMGQYQVVLKDATWNAKETAIIVCDMWDSHHSLNAVKRVEEIAPRMNQVLERARSMGALIIHAPSSCMEPYKTHPARIRAQDAPRASNLPKDIGSWCYWIPSEEKDEYPVDQLDGGDDTPDAPQKAWQAKLKKMGRKPGSPWLAQIDVLKIHDQDAISDSGVEIWNLLEQRGIKNIVLVGVHTNMCVLGRPFGLRQLAKNSKNVVLMRDMTDTMYNPRSWPYVSHFQGTDLIVQHIEKYVCPTITSDALLGGAPFQFKDDVRKNAVVIVAENEYKTNETLPPFAKKALQEQLGLNVRVLIETDATKPIAGFAETVGSADLLVLSARRRGLPADEMAIFKKKLEAGTPLLAIRTSSHGFDAKGKAPKGFAEWPEFDAQVIGGNYRNHHKIGPVTEVTPATVEKVLPKDERSPILLGVKTPFKSNASLYRTSPLKDSARVLLIGTIPGEQPEPVAWTNEYKKTRIFYTSLGHKDDFATPEFQRLLTNASRWLLGMKIAEAPPKKVRGQF